MRLDAAGWIARMSRCGGEEEDFLYISLLKPPTIQNKMQPLKVPAKCRKRLNSMSGGPGYTLELPALAEVQRVNLQKFLHSSVLLRNWQIWRR